MSFSLNESLDALFVFPQRREVVFGVRDLLADFGELTPAGFLRAVEFRRGAKQLWVSVFDATRVAVVLASGRVCGRVGAVHARLGGEGAHADPAAGTMRPCSIWFWTK